MVDTALCKDIMDAAADRRWYAVYTVPQNEKAVVKYLTMWEVESFLPTYETLRVWKNRQRQRVVLPLFPTYLFVRIHATERGKVLQSPGVLQILGNRTESAAIPDSDVDFLRSDFCNKRIEPYPELVIGEKVRIKNGAMQGIEGTLVRKGSSLRFVLTLQMINQNASIQVAAEDLELVA